MKLKTWELETFPHLPMCQQQVVLYKRQLGNVEGSFPTLKRVKRNLRSFGPIVLPTPPPFYGNFGIVERYYWLIATCMHSVLVPAMFFWCLIDASDLDTQSPYRWKSCPHRLSCFAKYLCCQVMMFCFTADMRTHGQKDFAKWISLSIELIPY